MRCLDCTHIYCSPIPKNIADNYKDVIDEEYLKHVTSRKLSAEAVLDVIQKRVKFGRLLDVGCATGDFLQIARARGFIAEGLELSGWSSEIAISHGFIVYREYLSNLAKKLPCQFDVITLMGVIEHFENPLQEMQFIRKLLKPNGIIVLWTGNAGSIYSRILGRRWWYWQGQHIQYFTYSSLKKLMHISGFNHIETKRYPFAATFETISNSIRRYKSYKLLRLLIMPCFALKPVWYLRLSCELLFIARKASN